MRVSFLLLLIFYTFNIYFAQKFTPLDLAGTWLNEGATKKSGEEWLMKDSTELNGFGFVVKNERKQIVETLMLKKMNGNWLYIAKVGKQQPISFTLDSTSSNTLLFVNKEHDFPQYIRYEFVDANHLKVKVGSFKKRKKFSLLLERCELEINQK
jgi:hypothetical protein